MRALLQSGENLKPLRNYKDHVERLQDADYVLSLEHREKLWRVPSGTIAPSQLDFVRWYVVTATRHRIPVYCRHCWPNGKVELVHAQYEDRLSGIDWVIMGQLGHEVVETCHVEARWGADDGGNPAVWHVTPDGRTNEVDDGLRRRASLVRSIEAYLAAIYSEEAG